RSTQEAVDAVSESLRSPVGYAGLKDKEAYTCQFITVRCREGRMFKSEYAFLNHSVRLYFAGKEVTMLGRGELEGNVFEVVLSEVAGRAEKLQDVVETVVRVKPFPNFYGYQRFGTRRPVTHVIGRHIVMGEWEEAVNALLGRPYPQESFRSREARELFESGRWREALDKLPKKLVAERKVLKALLSGKTFKEAMMCVGKWLLRFYAEAFQSYIFNKALSNSIINYGSVEKFSSLCAVYPIPHPDIKGKDECSRHVIEAMREEFKGVEHKELLFRGVRETSMHPRGVMLTSFKEGNTVLRFFLRPSSYASVVLREMFREGLKIG
ncbi:MAG: tRNA pseudouridine(13) synthase TruD, partial [Desulfurococcales archaeon]|nr:tRNA pseudouridine(13) synthase TruD [Desulfurococcales archaeon]